MSIELLDEKPATGEQPGATGLALRGEAMTMAAVDAAAAKAEIEAAFIVAYKKPRSRDEVRVKCLKACKNPRFAGVAMYRKCVDKRQGTVVTGLSIRGAEEVVRCMPNLRIRSYTVHEDDRQRKIRIEVIDLEANVGYSRDIVLSKIIERRYPDKFRPVLGTRQTSEGNTVYLVPATEDEMANKEGAMTSKVIRNGVIRLLPGDIHEEMLEEIERTLNDANAADPDASRKKLCDAFASKGITPAMLEKFLGHTLDIIAPSELTKLRGIFTTIEDGDATWQEIMEEAGGAARGETASETQQPPEGTKADAVNEKLKRKTARVEMGGSNDGQT